MTNLTSSLDPRCKKLMRWSIIFLEAHQGEAETRLNDGTGRQIRANSELVRTFNSYFGDESKTRRFLEEFVCLPIQDVVRIIAPP